MFKKLVKVFSLFISVFYVIKLLKKFNNQLEERLLLIEFLKRYNSLLNHWVYLKNKNILPIDYLKKNNINSIVIYGAGSLGLRIYEELKDSDINIKCFIDLCSGYDINSIKVISKQDISKANIENTDTIIVSPINYYGEIYRDLKDKVNCNIISLEEVIYQC